MQISPDKAHDLDYPPRALKLEQLAREVHQNYYLLKNMMASTGAFDDLGSGGAVILALLSREGPLSVPQMLQTLPTSRQYIQKEVRKLVQQGLVVTTDNPAHKSSKLLRATQKGLLEHKTRRERLMNGYVGIENDFTLDDLTSGLELLRKLSESLSK